MNDVKIFIILSPSVLGILTDILWSAGIRACIQLTGQEKRRKLIKKGGQQEWLIYASVTRG